MACVKIVMNKKEMIGSDSRRSFFAIVNDILYQFMEKLCPLTSINAPSVK